MFYVTQVMGEVSLRALSNLFLSLYEPVYVPFYALDSSYNQELERVVFHNTSLRKQTGTLLRHNDGLLPLFFIFTNITEHFSKYVLIEQCLYMIGGTYD